MNTNTNSNRYFKGKIKYKIINHIRKTVENELSNYKQLDVTNITNIICNYVERQELFVKYTEEFIKSYLKIKMLAKSMLLRVKCIDILYTLSSSLSKQRLDKFEIIYDINEWLEDSHIVDDMCYLLHGELTEDQIDIHKDGFYIDIYDILTYFITDYIVYHYRYKKYHYDDFEQELMPYIPADMIYEYYKDCSAILVPIPLVEKYSKIEA